LADGLTTVYSCKVRIGMPLRTALMGKVSSSTASFYSAIVGNAAAGVLWPTSDPEVLFCINFKDEMTTQFNQMYPLLGAKMMQP
jgi:hypothetical protein